ncbi:MAG: TlpA family protein disulfide reductase [Inquilinus limosus]|uniref:TlpA family protein disulfide reductase n=1 Tax=Inquilinus limosus TaxID=171674 RepID=A0A952KKN8_9PROT|nr:TlpA family protein disulfide reductase [Inquilinus limosus]
MRKRATIAAGVAGLALLLAAGAAWWTQRTPEGRPPLGGTVASFVLADRPEPAPEITFSDAAGNTLRLADFKGKVVLVNLWATWCAPCVKEMPALDRLQAKLGGADFAVLALSIDREGLAKVQPFFDAHKIAALAPYLDTGGRSPAQFGARGLPTTLLIDRDGTVVGRQEGAAEWDDDSSIALLRYYLDRGKAGSA